MQWLLWARVSLFILLECTTLALDRGENRQGELGYAVSNRSKRVDEGGNDSSDGITRGFHISAVGVTGARRYPIITRENAAECWPGTLLLQASFLASSRRVE